MKNNIILIGFMGTGKTTVGKIISSIIKYNFLDMDEEIEKKTNMSIIDMFSIKGEAYFREQEKLILKQISAIDSTVISCGGGVVKDGYNRDVLKKSGIVFCLKADVNSIIKRTSGTNRPLLMHKTREEILELIKIREKLYEFAHFCVDTNGKTPIEAANLIINLYEKRSLVL